MKTRAIALGFVVLLFAGCSLAADNPFVIPQQVTIEETAIDSLYALDFASILADREKVWVTADVALDVQKSVGVAVRVPEGDPNGKMVVKLQHLGTCGILNVLNGNLEKRQLDFQWYEPAFRMNSSSAVDIDTGIFVIQVNPTKTGKDQFGRLFRLPDKSYAAQTAMAVAFYRSHPELLDPVNARKNRDALAKLVIGDNSMLAMKSFDALTRENLADTVLIQTVFQKLPGAARGVALKSIFAAVTTDNLEPIARIIEEAVDSSGQVDDVEGLEVVARITGRLSPAALELSGRVMKAVANRGPKLKGPDEQREALEKLIWLSQQTARSPQ